MRKILTNLITSQERAAQQIFTPDNKIPFRLILAYKANMTAIKSIPNILLPEQSNPKLFVAP